MKFIIKNKANIIIEAIFENDSTEVTGFVNLTNGDFTQYIELNRKRDLFVIDDFVDDELYEFDASGEEKRLFREGFLEDFEEPFETAGKRFWGWSCGAETHYPGGYCERTCTYRVFWTRVRLSNGEYSQTFSCDDLPGRYN